MYNKMFIVFAGSKMAEEYYYSIIHREYPLALCLTISDILKEYSEGFNNLNEKFRNLFLDPESASMERTYFFVFPPEAAVQDDKFWIRFESVHEFMNKSSPELMRLLSVWAVGDACVSNIFIPNYRSYHDQDSLERGLRSYIRAQKLYNPANETLSPPIQKQQEACLKSSEKKMPIQKILPKVNPEKQIYENTYKEINMQKVITIFGASEADPYVNELCLALSNSLQNHGLSFVCNTWRNATIFGNGSDTISALIQYAEEMKRKNGYAVFFFSPDDKSTIRKNDFFVARDNVWLEYGLFTAILGPLHVFAVFPENPIVKDGETRNWHHPSDFALQRRSYKYEDAIEERKNRLRLTAGDIADIVFRQQSNSIVKLSSQVSDSNYRFNPKT